MRKVHHQTSLQPYIGTGGGGEGDPPEGPPKISEKWNILFNNSREVTIFSFFFFLTPSPDDQTVPMYDYNQAPLAKLPLPSSPISWDKKGH